MRPSYIYLPRASHLGFFSNIYSSFIFCNYTKIKLDKQYHIGLTVFWNNLRTRKPAFTEMKLSCYCNRTQSSEKRRKQLKIDWNIFLRNQKLLNFFGKLCRETRIENLNFASYKINELHPVKKILNNQTYFSTRAVCIMPVRPKNTLQEQRK